jgi:imidazolonepropionase-like amidohydrolase
MKLKLLKKILLVCLTLLPVTVVAQITIIHAGQLLAIPGQGVKTKQSIVISDGKIINVVSGYLSKEEMASNGEQVLLLNLKDEFVLPGLMDLHVHITMEPRPGEHLRVTTETDADLALTGAKHAKLTLDAGFTTIIDLGRPGTPGHETAVFALRDAIKAGKVPGPRILATGSPISATSQSRRPLYRAEVEEVVGAQAVCDGADSCRRAVRAQVKKGADIISFYNSGSLLFENPVGQAMTDEEMRAIVETAHSLGRRVIADGHHAAGIEAAIRAGVDSVDSIHFATKDNLELIEKSGTYMQSHIYAMVAAVGDTRETVHEGIVWWHPTYVLERLFDIKMKPFVLERAYRSGIRRIAFASDVGNFPHGDNGRDFIEYVKRGLPPMFAIQTATVNAAEAIGMADSLGSIEIGKIADVIATENSPLQDISELTRVKFVMREGLVFRNKN